MEKPQQTSQILAVWAKLFRKEGDAQTADAIEEQLRAGPLQRPTDEKAAQLRKVVARAAELERRGHYSEAADEYATALDLTKRHFGPLHIQSLKRRFDVARCDLANCNFGGALEGFQQLLLLAQLGDQDASTLARRARRYLQRCHRSVRDEVGGLRLEAAMLGMVRSATQAPHFLRFERAQRMRSLALRAGAAGRRSRAVGLLRAAIDLRLQQAQPDGALPHAEIERYIDDLSSIGEPLKALEAAVQLVVLGNRQFAVGASKTALLDALKKVSGLQVANGMHVGARSTFALIDRLERGEASTGLQEFSS